jgi:RNA polymerase sigma-70 factor, ECF subfamily
VSAARHPAKTLGDLLYADASAVVAEKDWATLVRSIAAGDQLALRALYDRMHRLVYTLSVRITGDPHAAEEVTLDVFHEVWRRAGAYDPAGGSVVGWIMNQTRSRAIDRVRFEQRRKRVNPGVEAPLAPATAGDPVAMLSLQQQGRALREALKVLTPDERQAIEAAYQQVAARLQQPLGTVKTRIRSALGKLREALATQTGGA